MHLDISLATRNPGQEFPFTLEPELEPQEFSGETIEFPVPVHMEGTFCMQGEGVILKGQLTARYTRPCSRCLEPVTVAFSGDFYDMFYKELNPDDPNDLYLIENYQIDMAAYATALIFLDMPMTALCSPDCRGLCPECGANLNVSQCSCGRNGTKEERTNPLAALEALLNQDEEV